MVFETMWRSSGNVIAGNVFGEALRRMQSGFLGNLGHQSKRGSCKRNILKFEMYYITDSFLETTTLFIYLKLLL